MSGLELNEEKEKEMLRQWKICKPLRPPSQPSINPNGDALDMAKEGLEKLTEDPEFCERLREIYQLEYDD